MNNQKFRAYFVDATDGWYIIEIQYKKSFPFKHWITIKTIESDDKEYLKICAEEILDALNMEI